jgi:ABC-type transport system substrate-binding protein
MAMLENGQADIGEIPPDKVAEAEAASLHMKMAPGASAYCVVLGGNVLPSRATYDPTCPWVYNTTEPWDSTQNKRALLVRQALALAIDKNAICDVILRGLASQSPIPAWPLGTDWARSEWKPYPYDPIKAKELLNEAGYPNGFEKTITVYAISGGGSALHPKISEAIATDWQTNLGLKVQIVPIDWPTLRAKNAARDTAWSAYCTGWITFLEPWIDVSFGLYSTADFEEGYEDVKLDALLDACGHTADIEQRKQAALALGDYLYEHIVRIGIATGPSIAACSSKVGLWHLRYLPPQPLVEFEQIEHAK